MAPDIKRLVRGPRANPTGGIRCRAQTQRLMAERNLAPSPQHPTSTDRRDELPSSASIKSSANVLVLGFPSNSHDSVDPVEVGEHQDVEQFGAGSRPEGIQTLLQSALEFVGIHGGDATPRRRRAADVPQEEQHGLIRTDIQVAPEQAFRATARIPCVLNHLAKVGVAGSNPVVRSREFAGQGRCEPALLFAWGRRNGQGSRRGPACTRLRHGVGQRREPRHSMGLGRM